MKILIISLPRSGSTNLMYKISKEKNLKPIYEPFDITHTLPRKNFGENIILKTIVNQFPKSITNPIDWYVGFSKDFDETILLSRKDIKSCAESLAYYNQYKNHGFKPNESYLWENTPNYDISLKYVNGCNNKLEKLSEILNLPIMYYEDMYDVNSKERLRKGNKIKPSVLY